MMKGHFAYLNAATPSREAKIARELQTRREVTRMLPHIATECRGRDRWYWRIFDKDGYSPWVGPYPTDGEALGAARDFCKREGDGYARSLLKWR